MRLLPLTDAGALLRAEGRHAAGRHDVPWRGLLAWITIASLVYGLVMGSYGGIGLQALYSALKMPVLLLGSGVVCLGNFFVLNSVFGLRDDFPAALRAVATSQATMALCLVSLAPVVVVGYASSDFYPWAQVLNGIMFAVASIAGQVSLSRHYRPLIASNPRHKLGFAAWLILYVFVAIQLAWVLRPYIGAPSMPTTFFRENAWSNAYVEVARSVWRVLMGGG